MIKVFISQPMRGLTNEEIINRRLTLKEKVREYFPNASVIFLDSFFTDNESSKHCNPAVHSLGRSLEILSDADVVVFAEGFEQTRGCMIEYTVCNEYDLDIIVERNGILQSL